MEKKEEIRGHILAIPYPSQGHINPLLQFCKHLSTTRSIKTTLLVTTFIATNFPPPPIPGIEIDTFSDGHDETGFSTSVESYISTMEAAGRLSISALLQRYSLSTNPITCVVYDSFLSWALDVAKDHGLVAAAFFTQPCTVNYIYRGLNRGIWDREGATIEYPFRVPGAELGQEDMPSYLSVPGSYAAYFEAVLNQHSNLDRADCVLFTTFYELEYQAVDSLSKQIPILPIGPTLPLAYLDDQNKIDIDYGLHLFNSLSNSTAINWLTTKKPNSTIYISFGSMSSLENDQMQELACALKHSNHDFLMVVRDEDKSNLPKGFIEEMETIGKGLFVEWCSQLQVLANDAVGCFVTHCGWNSTLEGLVLGVPLVCMPQWSDQPTNAKLVQDMWRVGVKARKDQSGVVRRHEIERCIGEVMDGDKAEEIRDNARKWRDLAKKAYAKGGSSDRNIDVFVSKFCC